MSTVLGGLLDVTGETLDCRLFDNGFVEYEVLDKNKKSVAKSSYTTDELKIKKETSISKSDLFEITQLLTSDEFAKLKNSYKTNLSGIDTSRTSILRVRLGGIDKTIEILVNNESLIEPNPKHFADYPKILSDLYKRLEKIK